VLNASRQFFARPDSVKRSARSSSGAVGGFARGYIPLAGEAGLRDFVELKEGFCYGRALTPNHTTDAAAADSCDQLISPNAWPEEEEQGQETADAAADGSGGARLDAAWQATLEGFVDDCLSLTNTLHAALSSAMGYEAAHLGHLAAGGEDISLMRLFHYFSPEAYAHVSPGTPRTGSSPHTDWHLVTIVLQDTTGGLQVT
jgi:isopenicillin N synthase-like dioxygenase